MEGIKKFKRLRLLGSHKAKPNPIDPSEKLHEDLLVEIADRLKSYTDYVRLRSVSKIWRSSLPMTPRRLPCQIPCLMLPYCKEKGVSSSCRGFFSPFVGNEGHVYELELPETRGKLCIGSSKGWLITLEKQVPHSSSMQLINPLTGSQVPLPPIDTVPEYLLNKGGVPLVPYHCLEKVILSSNPASSDNCIAMGLYLGFLICCKLGDRRWKMVHLEGTWSFNDIIHYKGKFYALDYMGGLAEVTDEEVNNSSFPVGMVIKERKWKHFLPTKQYLVEWRGELLKVVRDMWVCFETDCFEVYKLNSKSKWSKVKILGDHALFLGGNESWSFRYPGKGNCIYFTDAEIDFDEKVGGEDIGVFNLENQSVRPLTCCRKGKRYWPPPLWVMPQT